MNHERMYLAHDLAFGKGDLLNNDPDSRTGRRFDLKSMITECRDRQSSTIFAMLIRRW